MPTFYLEIERLLEILNGEAQELNNLNPAESHLVRCPECQLMFEWDDWVWHEGECGKPLVNIDKELEPYRIHKTITWPMSQAKARRDFRL